MGESIGTAWEATGGAYLISVTNKLLQHSRFTIVSRSISRVPHPLIRVPPEAVASGKGLGAVRVRFVEAHLVENLP